MSRVKRGVTAHRKRERLLTYTKGFRWRRKTNERAAKEALLHAWAHAFEGRKQKKRDYRALWNVKINAAAREEGMKYSTLIAALAKKHIKLDRKILAGLAKDEPKTFERVVAQVK